MYESCDRKSYYQRRILQNGCFVLTLPFAVLPVNLGAVFNRSVLHIESSQQPRNVSTGAMKNKRKACVDEGIQPSDGGGLCMMSGLGESIQSYLKEKCQRREREKSSLGNTGWQEARDCKVFQCRDGKDLQHRKHKDESRELNTATGDNKSSSVITLPASNAAHETGRARQWCFTLITLSQSLNSQTSCSRLITGLRCADLVIEQLTLTGQR